MIAVGTHVIDADRSDAPKQIACHHWQHCDFVVHLEPGLPHRAQCFSFGLGAIDVSLEDERMVGADQGEIEDVQIAVGSVFEPNA